MSLKFRIIFILNILLMNAVLSIDVMDKYGRKYSSTGEVFLDISGFNSGDKIYITAKTFYICTITNLHYKFCESTSDDISSDSLFYTYCTSYSTKDTYSSYEEKYNYEIKKAGNEYKYLYLKSRCHPPITFENTEDDGGNSTVVIIVAVICSLIALAIIIAIIVYCCRRCKRAVYNRVHLPVTPAYGVSLMEFNQSLVLEWYNLLLLCNLMELMLIIFQIKMLIKIIFQLILIKILTKIIPQIIIMKMFNIIQQLLFYKEVK